MGFPLIHSIPISRVFLLRKIWIVKYYVNCSVKKFVLFYEFPIGVFLNNQLHMFFLYCFDFNIKKFLVEKINIYNQQLNI